MSNEVEAQRRNTAIRKQLEETSDLGQLVVQCKRDGTTAPSATCLKKYNRDRFTCITCGATRMFGSLRELKRHLNEETGHFVTKKQLLVKEKSVVAQFETKGYDVATITDVKKLVWNHEVDEEDMVELYCGFYAMKLQLKNNLRRNRRGNRR